MFSSHSSHLPRLVQDYLPPCTAAEPASRKHDADIMFECESRGSCAVTKTSLLPRHPFVDESTTWRFGLPRFLAILLYRLAGMLKSSQTRTSNRHSVIHKKCCNYETRNQQCMEKTQVSESHETKEFAGVENDRWSFVYLDYNTIFVPTDDRMPLLDDFLSKKKKPTDTIDINGTGRSDCERRESNPRPAHGKRVCYR
jgi:hypothetical protein